MYISKILVQEILRQIGKKIKNDKDLIALLAERHAEIWKSHFVDASLDELGPLLELKPFDSWWLGKFTTTTAECFMRIKEILAAKSGRELKPLTSIKMSLSKQELLEIAKILKIRIPKGANQWDVSGKITAEIIKDQKKFIKTITKSAQKSRFLLTD